MYGEIGQVLEKTNHPLESLEMYQKAHQLAVQVHNRQAQAMLLGCLGNVLFTLGQESDASQHFRMQLQLAKEISEPLMECKAYHGLSKVARLIASMLSQAITLRAQVYLQQGCYDTCLDMEKKAGETRG
eukprot:757269-Hanusia_phi.AAC.5